MKKRSEEKTVKTENASTSDRVDALVGTELGAFVDSLQAMSPWKEESQKAEEMDAACRAAFTTYGSRLNRVSPQLFEQLSLPGGLEIQKVCEWYCGDVGFVWVSDL